MFTENPGIRQWLVDTVDKLPGVVRPLLVELMPDYMPKATSLAPALSQLVRLGALKRTTVLHAGRREFAYHVLDRGACPPQRKPFRPMGEHTKHQPPGRDNTRELHDAVPGVGQKRRRRRGKMLPPTDRPEFNFEEKPMDTLPKTDIKVDENDNIVLPTATGAWDEPAVAINPNADELPQAAWSPRAHPQSIHAGDALGYSAYYGQHIGRIERGLPDKSRPSLKLHAVMSDGTEYVLTSEHARQLRNLLAEVR